MPAPALKSADLLPALAIGAVSLLALAAAQLAPHAGHRAMAVFPPWLSPAHAFALAAAAPGWRPLGIVRTALGPGVVLQPLRADPPAPAGALLLTTARAGGCLSARTGKET